MDQVNLLSPMGKQIYKTASEEDKPYLLPLLLKDTNDVEEQEMKDYENDPDYIEKMENNGLGYYMEKFMSFYGICPVCKQNTLRKYNMSNMPVVDLICINRKYHIANGGCFLYQVKTTVESDTLFSNIYFNKKNKTIMIGSKRFGYNSHVIKGDDDHNKKLLTIGYICLYLIKDTQNDHKYRISKTNSLVLIPDLHNNTNEYYYEYVKVIMNKNVITWNSNLVLIDNIDSLLQNNLNVDTTKFFNESNITNPYNDIPFIKLGDEWKLYIKNKKNKNAVKFGGNKKYKLIL